MQQTSNENKEPPITEMFIKTIPENFHYKCIFTRRKNEEKKKMQFYLYSHDEENLFGSALLNSDHSCLFSLNANIFDSSTKWFAGSLKYCKSPLQYNGISFLHTNETFKNEIKIAYDSTNKIIIVRIPPENAEKFIFTEEKNENMEYKDGSILANQVNIPPSCGYDESQFRYGLVIKDLLSFTFCKIHEDEFLIQIGHPFSLFQAFSICIASLSIFSL